VGHLRHRARRRALRPVALPRRARRQRPAHGLGRPGTDADVDGGLAAALGSPQTRRRPGPGTGLLDDLDAELDAVLDTGAADDSGEESGEESEDGE